MMGTLHREGGGCLCIACEPDFQPMSLGEIANELQLRLEKSERVRRQLAEALRQIEFLPYSVTGDVEADLRRTKEIAHVALAASDTLDKEET